MPCKYCGVPLAFVESAGACRPCVIAQYNRLGELMALGRIAHVDLQWQLQRKPFTVNQPEYVS